MPEHSWRKSLARRQTRRNDQDGSARFGPTPATYSIVGDSGIRLHVRPGCLREGQAAGPVTTDKGERHLIECGKSWFFASAILDCLPSGSKFDVPLEFDFPVEEEDGDVHDSILLDRELDEYNKSMRETYQAREML
ncbi:unnamed protein product [Ectocarpus fasciculatus]